MALADINDSGTPYMGISSGRTRPCTHRLEQSGPSTLSFSYTAARYSLEKNVSKEVCFGCEGKITLFSFPKNPALRKQWMQFVFLGQQQSFSSVFVDERFINKAQLTQDFHTV